MGRLETATATASQVAPSGPESQMAETEGLDPVEQPLAHASEVDLVHGEEKPTKQTRCCI